LALRREGNETMDTYLITGVGRGIGRAMAEDALARGHKVIGSTRDGSCGWSHERLSLLAFDVTDDASVAAAAASYSGPVDVLINNSGVFGPRNQNLAELAPAEMLKVMDVNIVGPFRVLQAFLPHLSQSKAGRVLVISSMMGRFSLASQGAPAYRASKAGANKLVQTFAHELSAKGIAIIACHPGWVRTDMGGSGAEIDAKDSAKGLIDLAEGLTLEGTGCFMDWTGQRQDW
jgi:NAD(P)-dependent dehydrogenase (short-subunit alcohol dehydrogenase family)